MPVSVMLADDHAVVRDGLRALLEGGNDLQVVGVAGNGREAVSEALRLRPDIVIMDIAMPELDGVEATRRIVERCPETRVLILSMYSPRSTSTARCRPARRATCSRNPRARRWWTRSERCAPASAISATASPRR